MTVEPKPSTEEVDITEKDKASTEQVVVIEEDKDSFELLEEEILRGYQIYFVSCILFFKMNWFNCLLNSYIDKIKSIIG